MKIKEVISALEQFAPLPLQESWDNAGLQIGLTEAEVSGALLCLDVTEAIIDEAERRGCNMVVSHHPLLFHGLKQISDTTYVQRTVWKAITRGICVVSMHTNLDNAEGGVNYEIARQLRLNDVMFLSPKTVDGITCGSGVVGTLEKPMAAHNFINYVKQQMAAESAMCNELLNRPISRVAICGGAGDFLIDDALKANADAFITGEAHYHNYFGYEQRIQLCVIGHYESEHYTTRLLKNVIDQRCPSVTTLIAETNTNPIIYY